jgi:hypothetical protein
MSHRLRRLFRIFPLFAMLALTGGPSVFLGIPLAFAAPFTPGNLVVSRVGDGGSALTTRGSPVFLDEFTTSGTLVQSLALPTTQSGPNQPLVVNGGATAEGLLTLSVNQQYLILTGYGPSQVPYQVSLPPTTGSAVPRVIGRVSFNGDIDTSTALSDFASSGSPRSAASADGTAFWTTSSNDGVRYVPYGGGPTSTQVSATVTNLRQGGIFDGQLYVSTASGASLSTRLGAVGTGLPTTSGQTITNLPGITSTESPSPYAFFFADLDPGVAGLDTLYIADDNNPAGGILKFSYVGGTWVPNGSAGNAADGYRGLTGVVTGTTVTLYAIRKALNIGGGELCTVTDLSGYNGSFSGFPSVIAAVAGSNQAFRGLAIAPSAPTLVELVYFRARRFSDRIRLRWATASETDTFGFHLWRSTRKNGKYQRITGEIIPAQGGATVGAAYSFNDSDIGLHRRYFYKLEDIDTTGISTFHGPIKATTGVSKKR